MGKCLAERFACWTAPPPTPPLKGRGFKKSRLPTRHKSPHTAPGGSAPEGPSMCFSATASFTAAAVLGVIGVATLRHVR